jgi:hypothetical protein
MQGQKWMNARRYWESAGVCGQTWLNCMLQAIRKERFEKAIESETPTRKSMSADDIQVSEKISRHAGLVVAI